MSEETKEDIVCEMRMGSTGDMPCAYIVGMPDTIKEFPCGGKVPKINIKQVTVDELADRFEAAFKREPVSNWAAIRNALIELCTYAAACIDVGAFDRAHMNELVVKGRTTLAAPPRNCDVGTAEEQAERFEKHCQSFLNREGIKACVGCPCCGVVMYGKCELAWAQMPYESEVEK